MTNPVSCAGSAGASSATMARVGRRACARLGIEAAGGTLVAFSFRGTRIRRRNDQCRLQLHPCSPWRTTRPLGPISGSRSRTRASTVVAQTGDAARGRRARARAPTRRRGRTSVGEASERILEERPVPIVEVPTPFSSSQVVEAVTGALAAHREREIRDTRATSLRSIESLVEHLSFATPTPERARAVVVGARTRLAARRRRLDARATTRPRGRGPRSPSSSCAPSR